ncbi:MAG TPA: toll/interleukin-1 receptor domain-containing protein [Ktedonobacteraceae bacterium]
MEAGQRFREEIQKGIDRCQSMLVARSLEAMASKYVQQEYEYADAQDKPIISLNWRTTKVPPTLNGIHWANFQSDYDLGLNELLVALSRLVLATLPPTRPQPTTSFAIHF